MVGAVVVALAVLAGTVVSAAASGQESTDEVVVRIVARKLAGGKVEFGLQQRRGDDAWGERLLPRVRLFPTTARADRWLASSALALAVGDVRIVARKLAGGKVEFGLQRRGGDDAWGERLLPRVRLFPTTARVDRWLASSALALRDPPAGSATEPPTGPSAVPSDGAHDLGSLPADARLLIDSWSSAVSATRGVWPGFDLASIPAVMAAIDDEGAISAAVAFNHPNPEALGAPARTLHVDGHRIVVIGEVADPDLLAASPYQLVADIGGTDTFVLISEERNTYYDPETPLFIAYLVHEAFHRYQTDEWTWGTTRQYFDHYDYSAANLELVLLENRILVAAYRAEDPGDLQRLARQFAAVRATRHERDYRVAHDEEQERIEGSARFMEHRIGETIGAVHATSTNHPRDLEQFTRILTTAPELLDDAIKMSFSLLRFYHSGATLLVLLERLGASDVAGQLQDGRTPARLLERHVAPLGDLDELVAGARADHDPDDRLAAAAAALHELAIDEPPIDVGQIPEGDFVLTGAQIACLEAFGMEFSDTPVFGNRIGIPPNAARSCLARSMLGLTAAQIACLEAHGIDVSDLLEAGDRIIISNQAALDCLNDAGDPDGASP